MLIDAFISYIQRLYFQPGFVTMLARLLVLPHFILRNLEDMVPG